MSVYNWWDVWDISEQEYYNYVKWLQKLMNDGMQEKETEEKEKA